MKIIFIPEWAAWAWVFVAGGGLLILSCDQRKDSVKGSQDGPTKVVSQRTANSYEKCGDSREAPKKMSELTELDFRYRMGKALEKWEITEETSEVEELFLVNREWAIAAIRGARMPWLLGEIMGKEVESKKSGIQWIKENLKGEEQDLCMIGFAQGLGKSDPKLVTAMAEEMKPGLVRDKVLGIAILATAKGDLAGASDLFLEHLDDLKRGSHSDLYGWGGGLLIEMNKKFSSDEMKAMMEKPIFEKLLEINPNAILMVGDAHPEVAVKFCLDKYGDPAPLYGMVLRHLAMNNASGVDRILESASGRYSKDEVMTGLLRQLRSNEHESIVTVLTELPSTSYDQEIFMGAATYMNENQFDRLMNSTKSDIRKGYLLEGRNARK